MRSAPLLKSTLDLAGTIAVLVAAGIIISAHVWPPPPPPPPGPRIQDVEGERIEGSKITKRRGAGRVALVEFADYQCPFCARHTREVHPEIAREFIDAGLIEQVFLHFPLSTMHPQAVAGGEAAECAAQQGKFWEMHALLFEHAGALERVDLLGHAAALQLDEARFETCLGGETSAAVTQDLEEGKRLGVRGTPSFFIGAIEEDGSILLTRRIDGGAALETFRQEISAALEGPPGQTRRWWPL